MSVNTAAGVEQPDEPEVRYTYYGWDLMSGQVLSELDVRGAQPTWVVMDPGDLGDVVVPLTDPDYAVRQAITESTVPRHHGVAVDRNGTLLWTGYVASRRYALGDLGYTLSVPGILDFWRQCRFITATMDWTNADQFDIVRDLFGIEADGAPPLEVSDLKSGRTRTIEIAGSETNAVLDKVYELADSGPDGFEVSIEPYWVEPHGADGPAVGQGHNVRRIGHRLLLGSPTIGRRAADGAGVTGWEFPGNITAYGFDEDGSQFSNLLVGTSDTNDGVQITREVRNQDLIDAGGGLVVMGVRSWANVEDVATLDGYLAQGAAEASGFADAPTATVDDAGETAAGMWAVGDEMRLRITDDRRFPRVDGSLAPGYDAILRVQQAALRPDDRKFDIEFANVIEAL